MTGDSWVSLIALAGWLVLALGAYRARQVGVRKTIVMALAWAAIFLFAAALFTAIGR